MEDPYSLTGTHNDLIAAVIEKCSCDRDHAVAALKVHKNNVQLAISSIARSRPRRRAGYTVPHFDHEEKIVDTRLREEPPRAPTVKHVANISKSVITTTSQGTDGDGGESKFEHIGLEAVTSENFRQIPEFRLPLITPTMSTKPFDPNEGRLQRFSIERLMWAVQTGLSSSDLRKYLSFFKPSLISDMINQLVAGVPTVFYVVGKNEEALVRTWIEYGADVNARDPNTGLPLLAFAIINSYNRHDDPLSTVCTLLGNGADISLIPGHLYDTEKNRDRKEPIKTPHASLNPNKDQEWCNSFFEGALTDTLTISQKYFLRRRAKTRVPSKRLVQVANEHQIMPLFSLPFTMIGQDIGIQMLTGRLLTHLITPTQKPLVLTFAGPSGHGKTEVGRRLGSLLSLNMLVIDMTQINLETDLFGPHSPYRGYETGASLNNFLADNSGKRAIVVLDEIEKAGSKIMESLLIVFDEGRYQDRRTRMQVNCTNIIWILATNALDIDIKEFSESNLMSHPSSEDAILKIKETLSVKLLGRLKSEFGAPLSGRVSAIIPFLPFVLEEQMVIAHKYLLNLQLRLHQPISPQKKQLVGQIRLRISHDVAICKRLAEGYYDSDRGARSLETAVKNEIEPKAVGKYLEESSRIVADQPIEDYLLDVDMEGHFIVTRDNAQASLQPELREEIEAFI